MREVKCNVECVTGSGGRRAGHGAGKTGAQQHYVTRQHISEVS